MSSQPGTPENPLRVAIIGSGPSGFYAADFLQKQSDLSIEIDMLERLPTPYGLVRGGVAPDHPKIKSVTKVYEKIAQTPGFRFYGNVTFGQDLTHDDLLRYYHAIIYAVGAQTDRQMGIPGENLPGSYAATEFVGWYNGHPDYRDLSFDLTAERVAVIGNGNVAMDVARILASMRDELARTDIADYALDALSRSRVREVYLLGRRGPAQAAFTNPELKEFGELEGADVVVPPEEAELDPLSAAALVSGDDRMAERNVQTLMRYAADGPQGKPRRIIMRFLVSPVEIIGTNHVEAIKLVKNELYQSDDGSLRPRPTDQTEVLPVDLVFRSIGYMGVALPGVPFDARKGIIPNAQGRVIDPSIPAPVTGEYVVGWIKRGPSGIIGTNKPDSYETAGMLVEDARADHLNTPAEPTRAAFEAFLHSRQPDVVSFEDWQALDQAELANGAAAGRPRIKFSRVTDMLKIVQQRHEREPQAGD
jgi:ferredoxin--NADP+ reductase